MKRNYLNEVITDVKKSDFKMWQLKVNLDNDRGNYEYLKSNVSFLLADSPYARVQQLKEYCYFCDNIEWELIDNDDLQEYLQDFKNEMEEC